MAARAFLPYADPRLHRAAAPVAEITESVRMIWDDMVDTMEACPAWAWPRPRSAS